VLLRRIAIGDDRRHTPAIGWRNLEGNSCAHPAELHASNPRGIPDRTQMLDGYH
jgi:hypothetical protein